MTPISAFTMHRTLVVHPEHRPPPEPQPPARDLSRRAATSAAHLLPGTQTARAKTQEFGRGSGTAVETPKTPPSGDGRVLEAVRQAAELPAELVDDEDADEPEPDDDEPDEDEDDESEDPEDDVADDFDDDAGLLLDEEPRLSLR
nr:hypothetical protein StreXyl84_37060 [Streptomyces sp. Xyl84]